jgi:enoyl-CoA hydratase/carnithine racemase
VLLVRLNRPDRLNAYKFDMLDHLLREADADNDVRMIVGTDPTFPRWCSIGVFELGADDAGFGTGEDCIEDGGQAWRRGHGSGDGFARCRRREP